MRRILTKPIAMPETQEKLRRRTQRRQPFIASALIFEPKSETLLRARTADLGLEGCFIDTLNPFAPGTAAKVRIQKDGASFEARVKVVYSLTSMGMGLLFQAVAPEQLWVLHEWLGKTEGEEPMPGIPLVPDAEIPSAGSLITGRRKDIHCEALSRLIAELMAQGLLSEEKGNAILRTLSRCPER